MSYPDPPKNLLELEEQQLALWRDEDLFHRTLEWTADGEPFVFYEGPPTANGRPGLHHIISRTIKDLICRYRTQTGRKVTRIAGWDTHGLPVEIEAEKKLGISGKPEIEEFGIARFNEACRDSVFTYKEEWERLSERIGYWLDYSKPYVTYHKEYIESVWSILARLAERGLLYRGHKSVPYCPRCGTALSSHEVDQGYEDVEDPSLYFMCPLVNADGSLDSQERSFLVWTTTPWTVPSNTGLAVDPDLEYVDVEHEGRRLIVAAARAEALFGESVEIRSRHAGRDLIGMRYRRPLDVVPEPEELGNAWTVVPEDFVSAEDGTGIVHMAPAFGADDYAAGKRHELPMLRPIDDEAHFTDDVAEVGGMYVKDADPRLVAMLDERGLLFKTEMYLHRYPHCWRCRSPLIYMARDSWFAATSTVKDQLLANNAQVSWNPVEVGEGRFGEWLKGNVDWALSRDRFWGTPLPVWVCERDSEHTEWVGSMDRLAELAGGLPDDFDPHRPWIDEITWACACGGVMRRTPEVIDVWFDSGSMPYAQWHYPFENRERFEEQFPADYICEGLDQTRGWFYSLLAIATMLDLGTPFKNVIVNGLILDSEGQKMSKSRGNVLDPWEEIASNGADAVRWYSVTSSLPWADKRYDPAGVSEAARKFFDTLLETYRFFALYAGLEGWEPADDDPAPSDRPVMDRWMASRLNRLVDSVRRDLDQYDITRPYRAVADFVDDLSNWYVRRSRARFWGNADGEDARSAFRTLWEALSTVAVLVAPVTPFVADWLHRALTDRSAHLTSFPVSELDRVDPRLEREMESVRALSRLGRAAREEVRLRVRQPLRTLRAVVPGGERIRPELLRVLERELNVKEVAFLDSSDALVRRYAKPSYRALGPRFQKRTEAAAGSIRELTDDEIGRWIAGDPVFIQVEDQSFQLLEGDLEIVEEAEGDFVVRSEGGHTVALDPTLDDELVMEGLAREIVNRVQRLRKDSGLEVSDRIDLALAGTSEVTEAAGVHRTFIATETLAVDLVTGTTSELGDYAHVRNVDLDGREATIALRVSQTRTGAAP